MEEVAFAKINLALHVRGREPDGYHRIETIFAFAEEGDLLGVAEADDLSVDVTGPFADDLAGEADNLVLRAAGALRARCGITQGAALTLDKRLPVAAGLGGGSADAAAALRLLDRWWGTNSGQGALVEIAAQLGADVPACVLSRTMRGEGRGDRLEEAHGAHFGGVPLLIVNPRVPLPTGPVFAAWGGVDRGPLADPFDGRNDLEEPAISLAPQIEQVLRCLAEAPGAMLSRMSGSGASCFALFTSQADRDSARARIASLHPSWWCLATRLR